MNKFNVTFKYENKEKPTGCSHKLNRFLTEIYKAVPESDMIALMCEVLDLPFDDAIDGKRVVVEPSRDKLRESLGEFAQDEKFFKSELKRQKKAYAVFKDIMLFVKNYGKDVIELSLSKNEKVRIEAAY